MKKSTKIVLILLAVVLLSGITIGTSFYFKQQNKDFSTITIFIRNETTAEEKSFTLKTKAKFLEVALNEAKENGSLDNLSVSGGFVSQIGFIANNALTNSWISLYANIGDAFYDTTVPTPSQAGTTDVFLLNNGVTETPIVNKSVYLFVLITW